MVALSQSNFSSAALGPPFSVSASLPSDGSNGPEQAKDSPSFAETLSSIQAGSLPAGFGGDSSGTPPSATQLNSGTALQSILAGKTDTPAASTGKSDAGEPANARFFVPAPPSGLSARVPPPDAFLQRAGQTDSQTPAEGNSTDESRLPGSDGGSVPTPVSSTQPAALSAAIGVANPIPDAASGALDPAQKGSAQPLSFSAPPAAAQNLAPVLVAPPAHSADASPLSEEVQEDVKNDTASRFVTSKHARKTAGSGPKPEGPADQVDSLTPSLLAAASLPDSVAPSGSAPSQNSSAGENASSSADIASGAENRSRPLAADQIAFAVRVQTDPVTAASAATAGDGQPIDSPAIESVSKLTAPVSPLMQGSGISASLAPAITPFGDAAPGTQKVITAGANNQDSSAVATLDSAQAADKNTDKTASAAPLRSMQVQITGQDNQRIDLKLVEGYGSLSMSVRSPDGGLTRSLQEHLPELTAKLADQPGQAEWWTPKSDSSTLAQNSGQGSNRQDNSGSQGQDQSGGQNSGRQQNGRQSDQPDWVDELAAVGNSTNIRKEYIWHQ